MNRYFETEDGTLYNNDVLEVLKQLPDESIDCVITSPPYWALRNYGVEGQLGLEPTFQEYLEKLWEIFDEVYRVLKPTGTCWVNLGDTYSGSGKGAGYNGKSKEVWRFSKRPKIREGIPSKSLCLIPERFAIGMIERGWILRNEIIWHKPNCMPQSVKDRFTVDFEKIFFFVKQRKYYFEQQIENTQAKQIEKRMLREQRENYNGKYAHIQPKRTMKRNKRTVWFINTKPFKGAHFAVFPPEIPEICIKAGCPKGGIVMDIFMGAGTTADVAEQLNRRWIGIEINEEYCEIAKKRIWEPIARWQAWL
jgi:site-specific DNA-methyltransferase (adenine-specific)